MVDSVTFTDPNVTQPKKKKSKFKRKVLQSVNGWLFVLPALALMALFTFYPIVNSVISAFLNNYDAIGNSFDGVGFENFRVVIQNKTGASGIFFMNALVNTILFAVISVPISTILALFIAVALNSIKPLQKLYQTVLFLPYLTNALSMGAVFATFFKIIGTPRQIAQNKASYGIVNNIIMAFGGNYVDWLSTGNPWANRFVVIVYSIWSGLPFKILILFGALQNVSKQYYDAAKVDGASKATTLWKITVPLISPMLSYLFITGMMGGLKAYSSIVGIWDKEMNSGEMGTMVGYIYACINNNQIGYAAAGSLILFAIIMAFTGVNLFLSKRRVHF